jgi:hypothetical protein
MAVLPRSATPDMSHRVQAGQSAHHLAAAQAETAQARADAAEMRWLLELAREAAEEQRRLLEEMRCSLREYERRFGPDAGRSK